MGLKHKLLSSTGLSSQPFNNRVFTPENVRIGMYQIACREGHEFPNVINWKRAADGLE